MKKLAFCLLALTPAFAFAMPGPYATLQAGVNMVNASNSVQNSTVGFAGGAAAGYLWGNNVFNFGLEADALAYPNSNSSKDVGGFFAGHDVQSSYDGYNLSLLGVIRYAFTPSFDGFIKAGGAYVSQQLSITVGGNTTTYGEQHTFAPELAGGVGYMVTQNLEANIEWDHVFADDQSITNFNNGDYKAVDNDNVLLGLTYHFC